MRPSKRLHVIAGAYDHRRRRSLLHHEARVILPGRSTSFLDPHLRASAGERRVYRAVDIGCSDHTLRRLLGGLREQRPDQTRMHAQQQSAPAVRTTVSIQDRGFRGCDDWGGRVKLKAAQVARAGEFYVAAEIDRRGGYAVIFSGNMPGIDILPSDVAHSRQISLQVKTRTSGTWHARVPRDTQQGPPLPDELSFWAFVDLASEAPTSSRSVRGCEDAMRNDILEAHAAFLARYGGTRPRAPDSEHDTTRIDRIERWRDRWDLLGIFRRGCRKGCCKVAAGNGCQHR